MNLADIEKFFGKTEPLETTEPPEIINEIFEMPKIGMLIFGFTLLMIFFWLIMFVCCIKNSLLLYHN